MALAERGDAVLPLLQDEYDTAKGPTTPMPDDVASAPGGGGGSAPQAGPDEGLTYPAKVRLGQD